MQRSFGTCVINNISHYEKPSPLMEALVNDAGAKDLLDFYRLVKMSPGDVDSLEVTTSEGQVPLAGGYKAFIRNFQGMYSVCEKQIDWSDGMLPTLRSRTNQEKDVSQMDGQMDNVPHG
jgi:hypothetical protein